MENGYFVKNLKEWRDEIHTAISALAGVETDKITIINNIVL